MKKRILLSILYAVISFVIISYTTNISYIQIPILLKLLIPAIPFILGIICFYTGKNKITAKENLILYIFASLMSLFLIYSFNIYKHNPQVPVEVEVSTTHTKADNSSGYNINLNAIYLDNKIIFYQYMENIGDVQLKKIRIDKFNIIKYLELISNKDTPSKIKLTGNANKIYFVFNGGNDSGIAQIKINNQIHKINTFQPTYKYYDQYNLYYSKLFAFNSGNQLNLSEKIHKYLYIFAYFLIFLYSLYFSGCLILNTSFKLNKEEQKISKWLILLFASPIIIMGLFYLLIFFPAIMPFDCMVQWSYAHSIQYADEHPIFHSYLIHLLTNIWNSPTCVVITQILSLSLITGYFFYKLRKYSIPSYILFITSSLIGLLPYNGITLITLYKDVFYSIALYSIVLCTLFIYIEKTQFFKSKINIFIFISSIILISLTRYNGIYTTIAYLIILFSMFKSIRANIIKVAIISLISICVILLFINCKINIYHQTFIKNQTWEVPIHQIQNVFHYNGKITEKDKNTLEQVMPLYKWENNYYKYTPHNIIFNTLELMDKKINSKNFICVYLNILRNNFYIMFKDWLMLNSYIFKFCINPEGYNFTQGVPTYIANHDALTINFNKTDNSLKENSFFPIIKKKFASSIDDILLFEILYKPTPYFIILLLFGTLFTIKNGIKSISIYIPILLTMFFISISMPEMCPRYLYILFLISPVNILLSLLKIKDEN